MATPFRRLPYTSRAMQITTTPAPKSTILVEVEVPAERLTRALGDATHALSRRTKVPGFRPGKAPRGVLEAVLGHGAVLDEAVDRLIESSYRDALIEKEILPSRTLTSRSSRRRRASRSSSRRPSRTDRSSSATTATSTSAPRSRRPTTLASTR